MSMKSFGERSEGCGCSLRGNNEMIHKMWLTGVNHVKKRWISSLDIFGVDLSYSIQGDGYEYIM